MLKTAVMLHIFVETVLHFFFRFLWIECSKEHNLFEIETEILNNVVKVFLL